MNSESRLIYYAIQARLSPNGVLQFFNYEVQVVPAVVSEQAWIKTESYRRDFRVAVVEREILRVSCENEMWKTRVKRLKKNWIESRLEKLLRFTQCE